MGDKFVLSGLHRSAGSRRIDKRGLSAMSGQDWWAELVSGQWHDPSSCMLSAQPAHSPAVRCPGPPFGAVPGVVVLLWFLLVLVLGLVLVLWLPRVKFLDEDDSSSASNSSGASQ